MCGGILLASLMDLTCLQLVLLLFSKMAVISLLNYYDYAFFALIAGNEHARRGYV
jgi:hypothetical protein